MSAEKIIRAQARQKLKDGGLVKAIIGFAVLMLFFMIVDCVMMLGSTVLMRFATTRMLEIIMNVACGTLTTITIILLSPALLGYIKMMQNEQEHYEPINIVYYFGSIKRYAKALWLVVSFVLRMAIPAIVCFAPVILFIAIDTYEFITPIPQNIFVVTMCVLVLLSGVSLLIYSARYFLVPFLYFKNDSLDSSEYFTQSKIIMNGNCDKVVKLVVSFIWWIMLCVLAVPILYVFPYIVQSLCISGKWLLNLRNGQDNELF